jgi:hypothetical protein
MERNPETTGDRETEQEDDFNRARAELERAVIDYEMTAEEARAERRKRRERMRDSSSSSEDEEDGEHYTRSRDAETGGEVGNAGNDAALMPPPPLPQQVGEHNTEKGTKNPFVIKVNKVEINVIKAKSGVNPSGTPGGSADASPNSSSGPARTPANPSGAGELFGQSES